MRSGSGGAIGRRDSAGGGGADHPRAAARGEGAIEIPAATKARLGLDAERSWIVTSEVNVFSWPGPDLRPVDPKAPGRGFAYGFLPAALTRALIEGLRGHMRRGKVGTVVRDD